MTITSLKDFSRCAVSVLASLLLIAGSARAGTFYAVSLDFVELRNVDGTTEFSLSAMMSTATPTNRQETLTAPSGHVFSAPFGAVRDVASWADLAELIFGGWTFESTSPSDPLDVERYTFSVSPFSYESLLAPFPQVTPSNLSLVSSPFVIEWAPAAFGARGVGSDGVSNLAVNQLHASAVEVTFDKPLLDGATIDFFVATPSEYLPHASKPSGPRVSPRYDMAAFLSYGRTTSRQYFAVPEPSSGLALGLLTIGLFLRSTRRLQVVNRP